jgi:hypothetical protein
MKFFWILSDGEKVKEISKSDYFKMLSKRKDRLLGWIEPSTNRRESEVCLVKGDNILLFRIEQIQQVLRIAEYKKEELKNE